MNFGIIFKTLGVIAILVSFGMAGCLAFAWMDWHRGASLEREWSAIIALSKSTGITFGVGFILAAAAWRSRNEIYRREGLIIVGLCWLLASALGALPYVFSEPNLRFVPALFESVSGYTTTGSTVMSDIESFPKAILLYRALTQWLGGIGILVVFVAVLSFLGVGGKSIVQAESSLDLSDTGRSRVRDVAFLLVKVYLVLTVACVGGLLLLGMKPFEAICHGFCAVSTGGFSPKNSSVGHYDNVWIEAWIALFVFLSSIGFMLYIYLIGRKKERLKNEEEARYYVMLLSAATLIITLDLAHFDPELNFWQALRIVYFNILSVCSTAGFGVGDYDLWPLSSKILLALLMLIGGCAGSTAGGLKMNRVLLFKKIAIREFIQTYRPSRVFPIRLNGRAPDSRVFVTTSFYLAMALLIALFSCVAVAYLEPSLDLTSVIGCVLGTVFNIGPGFGAVGPTDNFGHLNSVTLVLLSFLMVLGRLEFFALLVLFLPSLWKRY